MGKKIKVTKSIKPQLVDGYYVLGSTKNIEKRRRNHKNSLKKKKIATKASTILSHIPTVKLVAITGSLAMDNAKKEADVDLLLVTSKGTLWSTRLLVFLVLKINKIPLRRANDPNEEDKLCLNLWLDETDTKLTSKNLYTAHELAQLVPLTNKDQTFERILWENRWLLDYWPKAVVVTAPARRSFGVGGFRITPVENFIQFIFKILNPILFISQKAYMSGKITREQVTPTRAFFHPYDWGEKVLSQLEAEGVMLI